MFFNGVPRLFLRLYLLLDLKALVITFLRLSGVLMERRERLDDLLVESSKGVLSWTLAGVSKA
jgi:hypothetical protein